MRRQKFAPTDTLSYIEKPNKLFYQTRGWGSLKPKLCDHSEKHSLYIVHNSDFKMVQKLQYFLKVTFKSMQYASILIYLRTKI